jgi:hypothetical protein
MKFARLVAGATLVTFCVTRSDVASAQGQPQTIMKVDVVKVSTGFRATKIIGSDVRNASNESIGKVDDIIISTDGKAPYANLSVGGFLGVGSRLIAVPYDSLRLADQKVTLPGATKEELKTLPEFKYTN